MTAPVAPVSLTRQLLWPLALLAAGLAAAAAGLGWWQMTRQIEDQLLQRARILARILAYSADSSGNREEMNRINRLLVAGGDVELAAIAGMDPLRLIVTSRPHWQGRAVADLPANEVDPRAVEALLAGREFGGLHPVPGRYTFVAPLVTERSRPMRGAQALLVLNTRPLQAQIASSLRNLLALLAAMGLLGAAGYAWHVRARVLRPLAALSDAFGGHAPGREPPPAAPGTAREIAQLGAALRGAFGQVRELNRDLEQRVRERTAELVASLDRERETSRLRTNFIGMVSHEYRNSLATIQSSAQILERYHDRLPAEEQAGHLRQITESCARLASLVEDVLLYSRSEGGRLEINPAPLDLADFCRAEAEEAGRQAGTPDRVMVAGEAAGAAVTDRQLLHHVLSNLLGNALKYSPADQPVELRLRREGEVAVLTVTDRGLGIPPDELPQLGEPFRRGRNVTHVPGTGLGLVMVRRCLDLLGGTLALASTAGAGTTATVTVPVFRPAAAEADA